MSKTNITQGNVVFTIENGVTVCEIDYSLHLPFNTFSQYVTGEFRDEVAFKLIDVAYKVFSKQITILNNADSGLIIKYNVKGASKCSASDVYDRKLGEHIAMTRAQKNSFKFSHRMYEAFLDVVYNIFAHQITELSASTFYNYINSNNHQEELCQREM